MEIKDIIIIILVVIIFLYNWANIRKLYKTIYNKLYPVHQKIIKSDLSLIKKEQDTIQQHIKSNIEENVKDKKLKEILIYALGDGKRVRPIIVLSNYKKLNGLEDIQKLPNYIIDVALSIEYIHCASLVLDDIMDDDDERRNKQSVHIKYGLTMAQLSSIMLCAFAMKNLFRSLNELSQVHDDLNKDIYVMLGNLISDLISDLSIGQYMDVTIPSTLIDLGDGIKNSIKSGSMKTTIEDLIHKKTSTLFEYCFIMPWLYSNYNRSSDKIIEGINKMKIIARQFGLMFQISDDFEDVEQDMKRDGKNSVMNYVINKGYYDAYNDYNKIAKKFNELAKDENINTAEIDQMIKYLSKKVEVYYNEQSVIE